MMTLSIMEYSVMLSIIYSECQKYALNAEFHYAEYRYVECRYAEYHGTSPPTA
jgi:hypothetical protein